MQRLLQAGEQEFDESLSLEDVDFESGERFGVVDGENFDLRGVCLRENVS